MKVLIVDFIGQLMDNIGIIKPIIEGRGVQLAFTVDSITLGDASEKLNTADKKVPSATLRHWTDQLEEMGVHYVKRNNRNERIYSESDIKIFEFIRDMKEEYGRRTNIRDISNVLIQSAKEGSFELRTREDAPLPPMSNRTAELIGHEDIKRLLDSGKVKQFMDIVMGEVGDKLGEKLDVKFQDVNNKLEEALSVIEEQNKKIEEQEKRWEDRAKKRDELLVQSMRQVIEEKQAKKEEEEKKGFWSRFRKN